MPFEDNDSTSTEPTKTTGTIYEATYAPEELEEVMGMIEIALEGCPKGLAIMSMMLLCIVLQKPTITSQELQSVVTDVSRFTCMMLEGSGNSIETDPLKLN